MAERGRYIRFGCLVPSLSDQGWDDDEGHFQDDADAIARLHVRGFLTETEVRKARARLGKAIAKATN